MPDYEPEFELQHALDLYWDEQLGEQDGRGYLVQTPAYVLQDAVERLKRYAVIVENLTEVGNYLWSENLRKYGGRKIHEKETPRGSSGDPTFKNMSVFVNKVEKEMTMDDAYVELTLAMCRLKSGDPTGLTKYLEKEEELFEQLDGGE
jgi:hypothetical protein